MLRALSNKYISVLVLEINSDGLKKLFGANYFIRAYRNRELIMEHSLSKLLLCFTYLRMQASSHRYLQVSCDLDID